MILPLISQSCIVTVNGKQQLGVVRDWKTTYDGKWRIDVWGAGWGYCIPFAAQHVELLPVKRADGSYYAAEDAYLDMFSLEEIKAHQLADYPAQVGDTRTRRVSSAAPTSSNIPKSSNAVPIRRIIRSVAK